MAELHTFGDRLHVAMLTSGLTVPAMAQRCKVSRQTVNTWLRMREADLSGVHLIAVAQITKTRARWLCTGSGLMPCSSSRPAPSISR